MASLRQIRRRMKSIENIHEITKAMEMIAAFRFKKAENRFSRSKAYFQELENLIANLSVSLEGASPSRGQSDIGQALFENRPVKRKLLVVMTGDKGLCGAYNANLLRAAGEWLKNQKNYDAYLVPVGKVGSEFFKRRRAPVLSFYAEKSTADWALAKKLSAELKEFFLSKKADSVEILYTSYRAGGVGRNALHPYLPLNFLAEKKEASKEVPDYIFEPKLEDVFASLLSKYLEGKVFMSLLESLTSEYSARMAAMKQATENGEEVLDDLRLLRNKTRQATITRELSEIVSGASVLV